MALRAWASLARLDKLKLIPLNRRPFGCGVSFSLPSRAAAGLWPKATKGDEAHPAMFFNRVSGRTGPWRMRRRQRQPLLTMVASEMA